jgi:DNA-binding NarL/FixJ family response regulator
MDTIRVLLADDHAIVRAGIRKMVEEVPGLLVIGEVGDGPAVLQALKEQPVDLMLTDVTMPGFDPIKGIARIRSLYPHLKILVVSAYDDDIYVQGLLAAGVNGYHLKDQPLNDLKLAIERVLAGERWLSSPLIMKLVGSAPGMISFPTLTNRQRTLLHLLKQGMDNQSIAQETDLSVKTVENHLTRIYRQLDVKSRLEAVNFITRYPQILGTPGQEAAQSELPMDSGLQRCAAILVVDDNQRYRKQLMHMIGKICSQAILYEAENIQEAVGIAQQAELQFALIDVVLGDENGITCARRIKAVRSQTRVVLMSAYPDREFHRLGLQAGAVAFLDKKDLDLPTLRQVLDDIIS